MSRAIAMVLKVNSLLNQTLILSNAEISLMIRLDLGARIDQLQDRRTGRDWLWHPVGYDPAQSRSLPLGAAFDDHWSGGWDEIFPNDAAGSFRGRSLVDHGELWSQPWDILSASSLNITLAYQCKTVPVDITKTIQLHPTQPQARIEYRLENQSADPIPFLFKQHAAIVIEAGDEILLPDCQIEPVALGFSKIIGQETPTRFPKALTADGREIALNIIPPRTSQLQEFYYSSDLQVGECGIRHTATQSALIWQFDRTDFPYVWVFQSYGGWQDHYVVVMEPATTMPYDLEIACQQGTVAQLQPREVQYRSLTVEIRRS